MRAEDIRLATISAIDGARGVLSKLPPNLAEEAKEYERRMDAVADFWRSATPEFCHAWMEATIAAAAND